MRVLSVASECVPFVKTGGLADVVGALPMALAAHGVDMRVMLPGYEPVIAALGKHRVIAEEDDLFGGPARLLAGKAEGINLFVLDAPHLYDRPGSPYLDESGQDWPDNPFRFAALSWTAAYLARAGAGRWKPHILHCHDWQAGLAPIYLRQMGGKAATVLTIHNIAFTGSADVSEIAALRLDPAGYSPEGFEFYGRISALKGGLMAADRVTTVSPTYARELATERFGMGLDGVIRARGTDMRGILNGIDEVLWNPATDTALAAPFDSPSGKAENRRAILTEMGLDPEGTGPLMVAVSRLTEQKGFDLLTEALPALLERGGQFAMLGSGSADMEAQFNALAATHPRVAVRIGYDEGLAHRLIAGGDTIVVPSRFEPCGLTQLYGLRYGTLPLVARTGGLADTVIEANLAARLVGAGTGFVVEPGSVSALIDGIDRLSTLWANRSAWEGVVQAAMTHPVGWGPSASAYAALYGEVTGMASEAA
ncbi:MAG: glycogen synthase GlgA [Pseudomonadota bacterium]